MAFKISRRLWVDGVQDLAETVGSRPSVSFGGGHVGFYVFPFGVG
jgi:hypothetical protein